MNIDVQDNPFIINNNNEDCWKDKCKIIEL